jgi:hypothetical protein
MATMHPATTTFEIQNESSSWGCEYGYYRIIITDKSSPVIKYLARPEPVMSFPDIRGERLGFNTVPEGDWNIGYLIRKPGELRYSLDSTDQGTLAAVEKIWHPSKIDYMALDKPLELDALELQGELQCMGQICSTLHDGHHFGVAQVVVNFDWCPERVYGPDHETEIYSLIENHGIGPKFLAHVTENNDRVIGYMVERVKARRATLSDLAACRNVLKKLHSLGVAHGSAGALRDAHFLITSDGQDTRALLHDFGGSFQTDDQTVLDAELNSLEGVLSAAASEQPDGPPKQISIELSNEIRAISVRDDGLHPLVWDQAFREGKITFTEAEHKEMLVDLRKNGWKGPVNV